MGKVDREKDVKREKEEEERKEGFKPLSEIDETQWGLYDAEEADNLPVNLQFVGRRFEDEKVLAIAEFLLGELGMVMGRGVRGGERG